MTRKAEQSRRWVESFERGKSAIFSCKADPRLSYTMYVPPSVDESGAPPPALIVAVHGSSRDSFLEFRDSLAEFGRWNNAVILCPLFPIGIFGDNQGEAYKYMVERDLRYDLALLAMVGELEARLNCTFAKFAMWGYSGGGQFVQRFAMLHPERLWAASIGAPGVVTLLDASKDWWVGVKNVAQTFGRDIDIAAMRAVPFQMVVGSCDVETWEIEVHEGHSTWMEGVNDSGRTRIERLQALRNSFEANGIDVTYVEVQGAAHDRLKCIGAAKDFFARHMPRGG